MKKRVVFKKYHYRECDSFADYLERMAAKGWIFKGWRLGLVFYKDQPRKETYAAEIFPEGDENDKRPEPNTQEYARYCEEAGWELVDSTGKFCVFRKIREDAVPIVTEEERYENVRKAEWDSFKNELFLSCFCEALLGWRLCTSDFITYIFSDLLLLLLSTCTVLFLGEFFRFLGFIAWKVSSNHRMKQGRRIFYGGGSWTVYIWISFRSLLYFIFTVILLGAVVYTGNIVVRLHFPYHDFSCFIGDFLRKKGEWNRDRGTGSVCRNDIWKWFYRNRRQHKGDFWRGCPVRYYFSCC